MLSGRKSCIMPSGSESWCKVVQPSLVWGLQTCRAPGNEGLWGRVASCQKKMIVKMLGLKRQPHVLRRGYVEPWLDYHIRVFGVANMILRQHNSLILDTVLHLRQSWAAHILRFGTGNKPHHLLKSLMMWRPQQR